MSFVHAIRKKYRVEVKALAQAVHISEIPKEYKHLPIIARGNTSIILEKDPKTVIMVTRDSMKKDWGFLKKVEAGKLRKSQDEVIDLVLQQPSNKNLSRLLVVDLLGGYFKYWIQETVPITRVKPKPRAKIDPAGSTSSGPIIVDKKYNILDGMHRYLEAKREGLLLIEILRPGPYEG